jgi:hypothetical protein
MEELPHRMEIQFLLEQLNQRHKHYRRGKKKQLQFLQNGIKLMNQVHKQPNLMNDDYWKSLSRKNRSHEVTFLYNDYVNILKKSYRDPKKQTWEGSTLQQKYDLWNSVFRQSQLFEKDLVSLAEK